MFDELKERCLRANLRLRENGLVKLTWGNVSIIDRDKMVIAIKPSGVPYETMKADDIVITDINGKTIDGCLKPSSDLKTHLELYKAWPQINSIVHTHSTFATSFSQANISIKTLGTTHADTFKKDIKVTRRMRKSEVETDYEKNTGLLIVESFIGQDPLDSPGVLVSSHGPFTWGRDETESVNNSIILEEVSKMAFITTLLNRDAEEIPSYLMDRHFNRKHGKNAYYGQKTNQE